ncbi:hypothetical protein J2S00_000940 [Caldalkalibacillus uzonensis]|uniref:PDZ domain-containing protein n=1 Tax=Caldalkalibacillus uzonensis TaxID=353224 RepID=A0ABU0CP15_9BACI|nr:hypothetical protein [Caldalkalibacillus uzonensis]
MTWKDADNGFKFLMSVNGKSIEDVEKEIRVLAHKPE